jgi:hypothetical protein
MGNGALPNGPSYRAHSRLYDAVEKGKNAPTKIFACAPAETGFV